MSPVEFKKSPYRHVKIKKRLCRCVDSSGPDPYTRLVADLVHAYHITRSTNTIQKTETREVFSDSTKTGRPGRQATATLNTIHRFISK